MSVGVLVFPVCLPSIPKGSEQSVFPAFGPGTGLQYFAGRQHGHFRQHSALCCESHIYSATHCQSLKAKAHPQTLLLSKILSVSYVHCTPGDILWLKGQSTKFTVHVSFVSSLTLWKCNNTAEVLSLSVIYFLLCFCQLFFLNVLQLFSPTCFKS